MSAPKIIIMDFGYVPTDDGQVSVFTEWATPTEYVRADKLRALVELLGKAPAMINRGFAAGTEEREGGSARRQGQILDITRAYEAEVRAALAALTEKGEPHDKT